MKELSVALRHSSVHSSVSSGKHPWHKVLKKFSSRDDLSSSHQTKSATAQSHHMDCSHLLFQSIDVFHHSFNLVGVESIDKGCLAAMITQLVGSSEVIQVALTSSPQLMNYEARGRIQSGKIEIEPYSKAGLRGEGQVVGIADSGLYDLSCFFIDDSFLYPTITTSRTGVIEPFRRKVIQYTAYADSVDELGGHGTHVTGSVAGASISEYSEMNGAAPGAKISFFDLGVTNKDYLKVPSLYELMASAYVAGARVHTNSWGNLGGLYGQMSHDSDRYTYDNDNFLLLFAGGNSGENGALSINSPANSKNVLTVGAGQVRKVFTDEPLGEFEYAVAVFSSIGPTYDGRYKPDIIAPGDFIQSAWAGSPVNQTAAFDPTWSGSDTCAVHQMSGTSMATPLVAGTAILVREYFMHQQFFASLCDQRYSQCQKGPFEPSGYFMKGLFIHSGNFVHRYSDPSLDLDGSFFRSFELATPPDNFQGYGEVLLKNILPLHGGTGLDEELDLIVWDKLLLSEYSAMMFMVNISSSDIPKPIKITLCWYDPPHSVGYSNRLLINDLDLFVETPDGKYFLGNKRNVTYTKEDIKNKNVIMDDKNPNELVYIHKPVCDPYYNPHTRRYHDQICSYKVFVQSHAMPLNPLQPFALILTTNGKSPFKKQMLPTLCLNLRFIC